MRSGSQTVGIALVIGGVIIAVLIAAWLAAGIVDSSLRASGAILGGTLGFLVLVLPLVGGGAFLFIRGRAEARTLKQVSRQREMLGIIESAGEISVADLALELNGTRDSVRSDLYDLVSKGLFAGYVDWDRGRLIAKQASELRETGSCPNCGAQMSMAGKGLIKCDYCGAEVFLP